MDIIFDIIDHIEPNTFIILTIIFEEKYNISIEKDINDINIYIYEYDTKNVLKFYNSYSIGSSYSDIKKTIQDQLDDISFYFITGVSSAENRKYISENFIILNNDVNNTIITFTKSFV